PVNELEEAAKQQPNSPLAEKLRKVHSEATAGAMPPPPTPPKFPPPAVVYGVPPAPAFAADSPGAMTPSPQPAPVEPARGWAIDLNPRGSSSVLGNRSPLAEGEPRPARSSPNPLLQVQAIADPLVPPVPSHRRLDPHRVMLPLRPLAAMTARFDEIAAG